MVSQTERVSHPFLRISILDYQNEYDVLRKELEGAKLMSLTLLIRNISELADISNYSYSVWVNERIIAHGTIEGHKRSDGWKPLVKRVVNEAK